MKTVTSTTVTNTRNAPTATPTRHQGSFHRPHGRARAARCGVETAAGRAGYGVACRAGRPGEGARSASGCGPQLPGTGCRRHACDPERRRPVERSPGGAGSRRGKSASSPRCPARRRSCAIWAGTPCSRPSRSPAARRCASGAAMKFVPFCGAEFHCKGRAMTSEINFDHRAANKQRITLPAGIPLWARSAPSASTPCCAATTSATTVFTVSFMNGRGGASPTAAATTAPGTTTAILFWRDEYFAERRRHRPEHRRRQTQEITFRVEEITQRAGDGMAPKKEQTTDAVPRETDIRRKRRVLIGRGDDCDIKPVNDRVSRHHCEICTRTATTSCMTRLDERHLRGRRPRGPHGAAQRRGHQRACAGFCLHRRDAPLSCPPERYKHTTCKCIQNG